MSGNNYSVALDLLNERFNNKRHNFQAHITEIMGIKRMDTSSAVKLRELSDKSTVSRRQIGEEAAVLDLIPSWEQFTSLLEKRCQKLENVEHSMAAYARGSQEESTTTKLRVVFDGSAVSSSGFSLNDLLMTGPTIRPKPCSTLLRFRTFPIALTGDICKMYHCVLVSEPDSYLQCILWRDSPQQPVNVFKLDTVAYGTRPASLLSIRSMHQLAIDEQTIYPIDSKTLKRDFYVDDLITGGESIQEVKKIMSQTTKLLAKGSFKLRKWCSNNPELLQTIPPDDRETLLKVDDGSDTTKTLGLTWGPASDCLLFAISPIHPRFYGPLGLIGPIISKAKIFLDWDESLPSSLHSSWLSLCADFGRIPQMKFPRSSIQQNGAYEIHGFSDASIEASVVSVSQ
ncbi:uncharacterized protein LOC128870293 [Anastrepha ludens]|uniref:uncharacterized protein LOC128870293 n=1 Tax=Anastrepha ludens TaxID=28586 RepID=UPI0023B0F7E5|nr:uncharacterized protein LOC128870293 [Anastrepha ludens]